jgi:hypothetical protein
MAIGAGQAGAGEQTKLWIAEFGLPAVAHIRAALD